MNTAGLIEEWVAGLARGLSSGHPADTHVLGRIETDGRGRIVAWDEAARELLGYPAEEVVGRRAVELLVPTEVRGWARGLRQTVLRGRSVAGVLVARHRDGHSVELEVWACPVKAADGRTGVVSLATAAEPMARARGTSAVVDAFFERCPIGLAVFDTHLRFQRVNPVLQAMNGAPEAAHVGRRVGEILPGLNTVQMEQAMRRVLTTGEPVLDFRRIGRTPADPTRDRVWSCSYFRLDDPRGRPLGVTASITDITEHEEQQVATEAGRARLALLNEAGIRIGTTLDLRRTAQELADVAVPQFADIATVDVLAAVSDSEEISAGLTGGAAVRRMGKAARAGLPAAETLAPVGNTLAFPVGAPYTRCVTECRPFVLPRLTTAEVRSAAPHTDVLGRLYRLGIRSVLMVPVVARGTVLGMATFLRSEETGAFEPEDVDLACDMAARAGVCIDNARLYGRERDTALLLQRSLLPQHPPALPGMEVSHSYQPAGDIHEVGGDWYDVVALPRGRAALVVGDVMGHGLSAAAVMGRLSSTTRALARLDLPPDRILHHLEAVLADQEETLLATCLYAECDPGAGRCRLACAGHPPPALVAPDGTARLLPLPVAVPLGIGGTRFTTTEVETPPGSLLVLYTDGLIEARGQDIDDRLAQLLDLLTGSGPDPRALCCTLIDHLTPSFDDDTTVLIARIGTGPDGGQPGPATGG